MIINEGGYKVCINKVCDFNPLESKDDYDLMIDAFEGSDNGSDAALVIHIEDSTVTKTIAIYGSWSLSEDSSVVTNDGILTILADPKIYQIRLYDISVTHGRILDTLGSNLAIYKVLSGCLIQGELEITRLDENLNTIWCFEGKEVFVDNYNGQAFEIRNDRIILNDWQDNHYELNFAGNLIVGPAK